MGYLCNHGELMAKCQTCAEFQDELEFMLEELDDRHEMTEYYYDYYLDQDERNMRQEEETS